MNLDIKKLTYKLFYCTGLLMLLVAVFAKDMVIYAKPLVIITLALLYAINAEYMNYLVVFSLALFLICETLFLMDFIQNFEIVHLLFSLYYFINIILLWKSLQIIKIRVKKIFTVQLIISMGLIVYVLFSVAQLIVPQVNEHVSVLVILIFFFAFFIGVCYYIYLNSKTVISYSLMVAASCFLIVNILVALNRLYVYLEIFTFITRVLQVFGQFFLIKFYLEQHKLMPNDEEYF